MSCSSDIGLELFTVPFRSPQASMAFPASNQGTARPSQPPQAPATAPRQGTSAFPVQQAETPAPVGQAQGPDVPEEPVPKEKIPEEPQAKAVDPTTGPKQKPQAQPEPPKKELSLDMTDHTIPAGKPMDASDEAKRKAHEEAEAKRKAEWETEQLAKKQAEEAAIHRLQSMSDADAVAASADCIRLAIECITRRNMKECVAEHIQSVCQKEPAFARRTMHPKKSMIHCFRYINRMARDYIKREMEDDDIRPEDGIYGGDVPDGLCYQWAVDYFNDPDAPEDREKEEKFIPRPYVSTTPKKKKTARSKKTTKKEQEKEQGPKNNYQQMSLKGVS